MFFAIQPRCQNRPKMLPEPPQKLQNCAQNGNLGAIMAHLFAYVGSSWRSWSLSCPSCSPSWRQHIQTFAAKCHCRADIIYDSPQDASATPSKYPKSVKKYRKPTVFHDFWCLGLPPASWPTLSWRAAPRASWRLAGLMEPGSRYQKS